MNSPARRKAADAYSDKLASAGWRKVTFRASPEMQDDLAALVSRHGTLQAAITAALMAARAGIAQPD